MGTLRQHHIGRPWDGREDGSEHLLRRAKVSRAAKVTESCGTSAREGTLEVFSFRECIKNLA